MALAFAVAADFARAAMFVLLYECVVMRASCLRQPGISAARECRGAEAPALSRPPCRAREEFYRIRIIIYSAEGFRSGARSLSSRECPFNATLKSVPSPAVAVQGVERVVTVTSKAAAS